MSNSSEGEEKILTLLGLTSLQARVYLALAKMDQATLTNLSSSSKIDRANVYRVITRLQELDLVEKMIMNPTHFKALPIDEGISMLLESKETEYLEVKTKTNDILERYKQHTKVDFDDESCQFALIPDGKLTQRKFDQMFDSNQETHDIMFYWRDYASDYDCVVELWTNLLDKGVKIRALVFLEKGEKLPQEILSLIKYGKIFEIRRTMIPPKATITIIDGKESMVSVTSHLVPCGKPGLWVHNLSVIGVIQEYFDMLWRRAKKNILVIA
jgi:sugar-specific transcriptional regulator TrmB